MDSNIGIMYNFFSDEEIISKINSSGFYIISYIKNPSEAVQMAAIKQDSRALKYIENPTKEVISYAISRYSGSVLRMLKNLTDEIMWEAINISSSNLTYIENPSNELIDHVLKHSPYNIDCIKNPTYEQQMQAVQHDVNVFEYIENNLHEDVLSYVFNRDQSSLLKCYHKNIDMLVKFLEENYQNIENEELGLFFYNMTTNIDKKIYIKLKFGHSSHFSNIV